MEITKSRKRGQGAKENDEEQKVMIRTRKKREAIKVVVRKEICSLYLLFVDFCWTLRLHQALV